MFEGGIGLKRVGVIRKKKKICSNWFKPMNQNVEPKTFSLKGNLHYLAEIRESRVFRRKS